MIWLGTRRGHLSDCVTQLGVRAAGGRVHLKALPWLGPCIKVCFPLPNGRALVIMRPEVHPDSSLTVISDGEKFGDPGFYFVVEHTNTAWARYVRTMKETVHVYAAEEGIVRADHVLRIWGRTFLRLHYRLIRKLSSTGMPA